jgi:hypothetical protein
MEKSIQIAWKIVPLRHFFPLKVVPLIEVLLYGKSKCELLERGRDDYIVSTAPYCTLLYLCVDREGVLT